MRLRVVTRQIGRTVAAIPVVARTVDATMTSEGLEPLLGLPGMTLVRSALTQLVLFG